MSACIVPRITQSIEELPALAQRQDNAEMRAKLKAIKGYLALIVDSKEAQSSLAAASEILIVALRRKSFVFILFLCLFWHFSYSWMLIFFTLTQLSLILISFRQQQTALLRHMEQFQAFFSCAYQRTTPVLRMTWSRRSVALSAPNMALALSILVSLLSMMHSSLEVARAFPCRHSLYLNPNGFINGLAI